MRITMTDWIHSVLTNYIKEGDSCVDATMGKGGDTLFLCRVVGKTGLVTAFDIQEEALCLTKECLKEAGFAAKLLLEGHEQMGKHFQEETIQCIMFNLGYLPGGNHNLATKPETTIAAIEEGLRLLKIGGIMSICIYSGGDSGFEERDRVLEYLKSLDERKYFIAKQEFVNKKNHPPMPVFLIKL